MSSPLASNVIDRVDKFGHGGIENGFVLLAKSDSLFARTVQTKLKKYFVVGDDAVEKLLMDLIQTRHKFLKV